MITWKKLKTSPAEHEQWNANETDALIRKGNDFEYTAYLSGRLLGTKPNLTSAKKLVHNACVGKVILGGT